MNVEIERLAREALRAIAAEQLGDTGEARFGRCDQALALLARPLQLRQPLGHHDDVLEPLLQGSADMAVLARVAGQLLEQRVDMPGHGRQRVARARVPDSAGCLPQAGHTLPNRAEVEDERRCIVRGRSLGRNQPLRRQQRPGAPSQARAPMASAGVEPRSRPRRATSRQAAPRPGATICRSRRRTEPAPGLAMISCSPAPCGTRRRDPCGRRTPAPGSAAPGRQAAGDGHRQR